VSTNGSAYTPPQHRPIREFFFFLIRKFSSLNKYSHFPLSVATNYHLALMVRPNIVRLAPGPLNRGPRLYREVASQLVKTCDPFVARRRAWPAHVAITIKAPARRGPQNAGLMAVSP